jgi:hypothetical protein
MGATELQLLIVEWGEAQADYDSGQSEMDVEELRRLIRDWCEAQAAYDLENFPGGFPKYCTARRLHLAGGLTSPLQHWSSNRQINHRAIRRPVEHEQDKARRNISR